MKGLQPDALLPGEGGPEWPDLLLRRESGMRRPSRQQLGRTQQAAHLFGAEMFVPPRGRPRHSQFLLAIHSATSRSSTRVKEIATVSDKESVRSTRKK